ncbi:tetratricopeptide repeat protein [Ekhidna sp.]|uniref:tetratricopeptide repeat protein n=1 Tax=Ekhidna sp. TaxID=2608089 RepID=UPI003514BAB5
MKSLSLRVLSISFLLVIVTLAKAQNEFDSLAQIVRSSRDTVVQVDALNEMAYLMRVTNPDTTVRIAKLAEQLAKTYNYPLGEADAQMRRAIGLTQLGNYYDALQLYLSANSIYESLKNQARIASSLNNIGRLYGLIEDYDRALDNYKEAAKLFAELKHIRNESAALNNIGYLYKLRGEYDTSISFLNRSRNCSQLIHRPESEVYPIYNIGSVYMLQNMPDSAFRYLNKSRDMAIQQQNQYILSLSLIDLGLMYSKLGQIKEAETSFSQAYDVASSAGMRSEKSTAALHLSEVLEKQRKYRDALQFHKVYKTITDSLFNRDLARRMAFQEAEYEYNQKQIQDEVARKKEEIEQAKILSNALWIRNTLIAGIVAMILICYLFYINFKRKRYANEALKKLNQQIESQAEELRRANHEITVMNTNLETIVNQRTRELKRRNKQLKEYLSSNSHIVRAPLARILGLVDLYDPKDSENLDFITKSLHTSATELDNALRQINEKLSDENVEKKEVSS